jgi:hypothetical protein
MLERESSSDRDRVTQIFKVTNGTMTAPKGVWSWTAQENRTTPCKTRQICNALMRWTDPAECNLKISIELLDRSKHRRVTTVIFAIEKQECRTVNEREKCQLGSFVLRYRASRAIPAILSSTWACPDWLTDPLTDPFC